MAFQKPINSHHSKSPEFRHKIKKFNNNHSTGNLYYARIKTEYGYFYKLGFTGHSSVEERFSFKTNGNHELLDYIFFIENFSDAYQKEQLLHSYFSNKRAFGKYSSEESFPLYQDGQSELYYEDILEVDGDYTQEQANETKKNIFIKKCELKGKNHKVENFIDNFLIPSVIKLLLLPITFPLYIISCIFNKEKNNQPEFKSDIDDFLKYLYERYYTSSDMRRSERIIKINKLKNKIHENKASVEKQNTSV